MRVKLTKKALDKAKAAHRDAFLWDSELHGFGVKITPAGSKVYILQYRMGGRLAPSRRYTIGKHGVWTPETARQEAKRLLGLIAIGTDPGVVKVATKEILTVKALAERYLAEHARPKKKARSVAEDERNLRLHVLPRLGSRRLDTITRADVAKLHHELGATPIAANRVLALLTTIFNKAEKWGLRPDGSNPCRHIDKDKETRRQRVLSFDELKRLGAELTKADLNGRMPRGAITALLLLIFLGARKSEVLELQWKDVDYQHGSLWLGDSKTGQRAVHLNAPAIKLLRSLPRVEGNPYVLPGHRTGKHLVNIKDPWGHIRKAAKLEDVRIHDLRHSFASVGAGAGLGLPIIGGLLGHTQAATTQRYAHLAADPLKQATELIGDRLARAMQLEPRMPEAPVVPIRKRGKLKKEAQL